MDEKRAAEPFVRFPSMDGQSYEVWPKSHFESFFDGQLGELKEGVHYQYVDPPTDREILEGVLNDLKYICEQLQNEGRPVDVQKYTDSQVEEEMNGHPYWDRGGTPKGWSRARLLAWSRGYLLGRAKVASDADLSLFQLARRTRSWLEAKGGPS